MDSDLNKSKVNSKKIHLLERMLNELMPKIYPVIRYIKIEGPEKQMRGWITFLNYEIDVYTTIPEGITKDDYWTSEYRDMDFSWMAHHHVDEMLKYLSLNPNDFFREVYVYNINDELIGEF